MTEPNSSQPSFIPKSRIPSRSDFAQAYSSFSLAGILIFVLVLLTSFLFFAYEFYLERKVAAFEEELLHPDEIFDSESIEDLIVADSRIRVSENLFQNKTAPTYVFEFLEDLTTGNVFFSRFLYRSHLGGDDDMTVVTVRASAPSFNAVAFQFDVFRESGRVDSVNIENIYLDQGRVVCDFVLGFSESRVLYKENI